MLLAGLLALIASLMGRADGWTDRFGSTPLADFGRSKMVDVFEVARMLVAHAVGKHEDEISIIAYYGSHATGTAGPRSDLDLFYIPVEGKSPDVARSFVIDGITFDFWPITWEEAQQITDGRFRSFSVAPSILAHATVLHARTEEDRARLESLRRRIAELKEPAAEVEMVRRGLAAFPNAVYQLENLRLACAGKDAAAIRECGWRVVTIGVECLALVNQVTFDRAWARDLGELDRLEARPAGLQAMIRTITTSTDGAAVLAAAERLVAGTRAVLRERQEARPSERRSSDVFRGAYAEIHEHLQKLRSACEANDPVCASLESRQIQDDLCRMMGASLSTVGYSEFNRFGEYAGLYRELGFPDLMAAFDPADLGTLADLSAELDTRIVSWFKELGIVLDVFASTEELARWLDVSPPGR